MSRRVSKMWDYFVVNAVDNTKVNCIICHEKVTRGGKDARTFGTTAMINHLRGKHEVQFKVYEAHVVEQEQIKKRKYVDEFTSSASNIKKQRELEFFIERAKLYDVKSTRHASITKKIGEMICFDLLPFSVVENIGFKRVVHELDPRYSMPSRAHFSRSVIPDMFSSVRASIQVIIDEANSISFTSDVWTSTNNLNAFLSLTAHWIDDTWSRRSAFLRLQTMEGSQTGQLIGSHLQEILREWNINDSRKEILVRDNGASMKVAARLARFRDLGCFIHTIQLVVNDGLKPSTQKAVADTIAVARSIVGHFRHSTKATDALRKIQVSLQNENVDPDAFDKSYPQHKLIQDVPTRWNSTFYMLERLHEQKRAIGLYSQENNIVTLTPDQWNLIDKLIITLRPFEQETKTSSLSTASAAMIIPSVRMLSLFLKKSVVPGDDCGINIMSAHMLEDLESRFSDIEQSKICVLATCLDPTAKLCFFSSNETRQNARKWLMEEAMIEYKKKRENINETTNPNNSDNIKVPTQTRGQSSALFDYWNILVSAQQVQGAAVAVVDGESICRLEVTNYFEEPLKPRALPSEPVEDPVSYWKSYGHLYPNVSAVARRVLGTPASSVDSERAFSAAAEICNNKRASLSPHQTEMLLFLKKNLPNLNFNY